MPPNNALDKPRTEGHFFHRRFVRFSNLFLLAISFRQLNHKCKGLLALFGLFSDGRSACGCLSSVPCACVWDQERVNSCIDGLWKAKNKQRHQQQQDDFERGI
jgi:hypothetical protein